MRMWLIAAMLLLPTPVAAQDKLFDATNPAEVAAALREAGYKAELKTNEKGEPFISSAANGDSFTVDFYGCKAKVDCGSFQFYSWYKKDPAYTLAVVNEWNASKRFLKIAIDKDGDLSVYMDATGVGKMTQAAFADLVDWYQVMDADLDTFLTAKSKAATKP